MSRFVGKAVIVTGSSSGIGRATAALFAREGAKVTITGRKADELEITKALLIKEGSSDANINVIVGDITDESIQQKLIDSTVSKFGKLDILINNAGASIPDPTGKTGFAAAYSSYEKTMQLNVNSVLQILDKARSHLVASKGEVVNVSSIAALKFGYATMAYYAIAKAALDQLTRAASIDLIEQDVRVNSVNPGVVETKFMNAMGVPEAATKSIYDHYAGNRSYVPTGKVGEPEDIATVIAFLSDRKASGYIIGQCIVADGGSSLVMGMSEASKNRAKLLEEQAKGKK